MTRRRTAILLVILVLAIGGGGGAAVAVAWRRTHARKPAEELLLYGNVDLRQIDLAFNNNERIAAVLALEGQRVRRGQVLARLDTSRLLPQVSQAQAQASAQKAAVDRLRNGSRPEEIAQARANVDAAKADAENARVQFNRVKNLADRSAGAISQQDIDNARAAVDVADAKLAVNQKALDLAVAGPRVEDIAQAEAQLQANEAQLAFLRQQLADAQLLAPIDAVVRARLMEPGEMASPQKPVFTLAIIDPKWVRAYVSERDLGQLREGMPATVTADSFPGRRFGGWIGFISPIAEFTPKPVQTEELRTKLVFETRIFVTDPGDELRLGMPATVHVPRRGEADEEHAAPPTPPATTLPAAVPTPPAN